MILPQMHPEQRVEWARALLPETTDALILQGASEAPLGFSVVFIVRGGGGEGWSHPGGVGEESGGVWSCAREALHRPPRPVASSQAFQVQELGFLKLLNWM